MTKEANQAATAKYTRERRQLLDWVETNREIKEQANQNFRNTDYAFKLYINQTKYSATPPTQQIFLPPRFWGVT